MEPAIIAIGAIAAIWAITKTGMAIRALLEQRRRSDGPVRDRDESGGYGAGGIDPGGIVSGNGHGGGDCGGHGGGHG
jgi:hypothetical protein